MVKIFIFKIFIVLFISFIILAGISFSQKYLYRILPSDFDRHAIILDVLKDKTSCNNILFFGDSQATFGVDTRIIKDSLQFNGEIYNLSSPGQHLYESSYFYGLIKDSTKAVIQCLTPAFFSENIEHTLRKENAVSMFLGGYRINNVTKDLIKDYNGFFDQSSLRNYFESRFYFKTYIHSLIRRYLDNEKVDKTAWHSIYFPNTYINKKHPNYPNYKYDCGKYKSQEKPIYQLSFLSHLKDYFNRKGIIYILVLMPVNPDECRECYEDFKIYRKIIEKETYLNVIDLSDYIQDPIFFYDADHTNKDGAILISSRIGNELKILYH